MLRRVLLFAVVVACLLPGAAHAADVRSGPLQLRADDVLSVRQQGVPLLTESPATPADGPGRLGFADATGWHHATGVVTRGEDQVTLATTDPAGGQITVAVAARGDGIVGLTATAPASATAVGVGFLRPEGEAAWGFGQRSDRVDQRGRTLEAYVSDGPFSSESRNVVRATIPPAGFRDRDDATYYPVPWMLSSRGYGVLVDSDETSTWAMGGGDRDDWTVQVAASELRMRVFAGPTPAKALERFTKATGRQPAPRAPWTFGPWLQTGQPNAPALAEQREDLAKLRRADAPVSAAETQLRYLPCGLDRGLEDYERERVDYYHGQGLAVLTYVNPMVCQSYDAVYGPAAAAGALQQDATGAPQTFGSFVGGVGPAGFSVQQVSQFDFTAAAGRSAYAAVLQRIIDTGHDGWMEDFGEYTPLDAVSADGTPGAAMHNRYPTTYHCAAQDAVHGREQPRPIVRFQRSGWTGAARCADIVWGGDPTTGFGFDGLSSVVTQALTIGMSGVSRWGSDIGGYDTIGEDPKLTPELLKRWIQVGAVSGVMRIKKSGLEIPKYERPQVWDAENIGVWRRYTKLHTQLYPYLAAADATYRRTGLPLMRHLALDHPDDRRARAADDEYGFGDDLLAAPVLKQGARSREVYLPRGRWVDLRRSLTYAAKGDGAYGVGRVRTVRGGRTITTRAKLDELPLYARAGTVLPMLPADVSTLSGYRAKGVKDLRDNRDRLTLLAVPAAGRRAAGMFEDERLVSTVRGKSWTLQVRGKRARTYRLQAATAGLGFSPQRVAIGDRVLPRSAWRVDRRGVLRVAFRTTRGTLRITA